MAASLPVRYLSATTSDGSFVGTASPKALKQVTATASCKNRERCIVSKVNSDCNLDVELNIGLSNLNNVLSSYLYISLWLDIATIASFVDPITKISIYHSRRRINSAALRINCRPAHSGYLADARISGQTWVAGGIASSQS
jgi:hypothetical protein